MTQTDKLTDGAVWSPALAERFDALLGPKGVLGPDDAAPMLEEWRGRWHGEPAIVVTPGSAEDVAAVLKACAQQNLAVTPQGGNTGLVGGQTPTNGEVLLSLKRMNKIRDVAPLDNVMVVEAGVTLAAAQDAAAEADRLFPLSIGSEGSCQIGGIISTNAGGVNVVRYGNTRDLVLGLEAVTADGEIWHGLSRLRKDNTGYDLKHLFIGGEGTLGVVTAASLKLFPRPRDTVTFFAGVRDAAAAVALLSRAQSMSGGLVSSFEFIGGDTFSLVLKNIPDTRNPLAEAHPTYVLGEFSSGMKGALRPIVEEFLAAGLEAGDVIDAVIAENDAQAQALWRMRHTVSESMKREGACAKHDVSAPVARLPDFLRDADAAVQAACPGARIMPFGHIGDGNIHYDVLEPSDAGVDFEPARERIESAVYDVIDRYGGSISAEHGVGLARRAALADRKDPVALAMMRKIKDALDPQGRMNPGKML
ncbi:MAG: FAD-binding oxidoreductase [Pseudomonadota bacterium]